MNDTYVIGDSDRSTFVATDSSTGGYPIRSSLQGADQYQNLEKAKRDLKSFEGFKYLGSDLKIFRIDLVMIES
jgi:hypothetical protein